MDSLLEGFDLNQLFVLISENSVHVDVKVSSV